jgi:hypothetical protein
MNTRLLIATSLLGLAALPALADTVIVGDGIALRESTTEVPARGMRMKLVEQRFGAPQSRHAPVGRPPISRWDYAGYSVYFENDHVVHAVVHGAPDAAP